MDLVSTINSSKHPSYHLAQRFNRELCPCHSLRINFIAPGTSTAAQLMPLEAKSGDHYIREITFKAKVATNLNNTFRLIKELRKSARPPANRQTRPAADPTDRPTDPSGRLTGRLRS